MSLLVRTARLGYRADQDWLDVSLDGNLKRADAGATGGHRRIGFAFAPSPGIVRPLIRKRRSGELADQDWDRYVAEYVNEMRTSYVRHPDAWRTLLSWERVVLLCFCTDAERCHRTVLGRILSLLPGVVFEGEIQKEKKTA